MRISQANRFYEPSENMDEELLIAAPSEPSECPEDTKWKVYSRCCGQPLALVMPTDRLFCRHWEFFPCVPSLVALIIIFCYTIFVLGTCRFLPNAALVVTSLVQVTLCISLFAWSYFAAVLMDPGFLPYNWVMSRRLMYSWEEQLSGLAIRPDQLAFGAEHKPSFASFSTQSGRFVIRGDHICGWTQNWVGKRNHKQFLLLNFWGIVTVISIIVWSLLTREHSATRAWTVLAAVVEVVFAVLFLFMLTTACCDMARGRTQIQRWKGEDGVQGGCSTSWKDIFGSGSPFLWLIPTPAFGDDPFQ
jgi:hypothetical protein